MKSVVRASAGGVLEEAMRKDWLSEMDFEESGSDWDWERWKRHFQEMEEQADVVSILKVNGRFSVLLYF